MISTLMPEPYRTRLVQASAMHFQDNGTMRRVRVIDEIRREAAVEHPELFVSDEEAKLRDLQMQKSALARRHENAGSIAATA